MTTKLIALALLVAAIAAWLAALWLPCEVREPGRHPDRRQVQKMSKIEWTGETWNPVVGCSVLSPGCTNCYAIVATSGVALAAALVRGALAARAGSRQIDARRPADPSWDLVLAESDVPPSARPARRPALRLVAGRDLECHARQPQKGTP